MGGRVSSILPICFWGLLDLFTKNLCKAPNSCIYSVLAEAAKVTSGSSNTGVIAGSLIAVLLIVIGGLGLAVFLRRRNKAR